MLGSYMLAHLLLGSLSCVGLNATAPLIPLPQVDIHAGYFSSEAAAMEASMKPAHSSMNLFSSCTKVHAILCSSLEGGREGGVGGKSTELFSCKMH